MATTNVTTNAPEYQDYKIEDAKIVNVLRISDNGEDRISFVLDKTFKSFDFKTKEEIETNTFSLAPAEANRQLMAFVPHLQLANAYLMGSNVPLTLLSLVMRNAKVDVKRTFKKKGEQRENSSDTYTMNLFKSTFEKVELNIEPLFTAPIERELAKLADREDEDRRAKRAEVTETTTRKAVFGWQLYNKVSVIVKDSTNF